MKVFGLAAGIFCLATSLRAGQFPEKGFFLGSIEGDKITESVQFSARSSIRFKPPKGFANDGVETSYHVTTAVSIGFTPGALPNNYVHLLA